MGVQLYDAREDEATEITPMLVHAGPGATSRHPAADGTDLRLLQRRGAALCGLLMITLVLPRRGPAENTDASPRSTGHSGCSVRDTHDCNGGCAPTEWIGDGWCDIGTDGHDLNCTQLNYDGGDCAIATLAARQLHCLEDELLDCHGNCFPRHWLGDHDCDDPDEEEHMVYLNCAALGYDNGDCIFDEAGCMAGYVPAPCVVEPLGLPRVCVPEKWLGDGSCDVVIEDGYVRCNGS